jgi:hypothetical protein
MVELLILLALVTGGLIVAGLTLGPRSRDQARRAHRLLAILHDDATARVRDEQEHLVTLGALRETRNRVAAGTFEPATFDPFRQPLSRQQPVGPVVAVLLAIAVGAVALLLMAHSSQP